MPPPVFPQAPRPFRCLAADASSIAEAAAVLRGGGLVAFPTETVYGLGADATSGTAVAGIYRAKGRPSFNPLIAHVLDTERAREEGSFGAEAAALASAFWPGPLTLVVPAAPTCRVSDLARAGLASVALRVPAHPNARALIAAADVPVAAPSANRSGRISPTSAADVLADLAGRIDLVLDGGPTTVGLESTIVSCLGLPTLLRPGGIARSAIEAVLGASLAVPARDDRVLAPGMLASHYAPRASLRLAATHVGAGEGALDFGGRLRGTAAGAYRDLSPRGDLREAATNLFGFLRLLDAEADAIAVAPVPARDLGEAINDRLARAAAR